MHDEVVGVRGPFLDQTLHAPSDGLLRADEPKDPLVGAKSEILLAERKSVVKRYGL